MVPTKKRRSRIVTLFILIFLIDSFWVHYTKPFGFTVPTVMTQVATGLAQATVALCATLTDYLFRTKTEELSVFHQHNHVITPSLPQVDFPNPRASTPDIVAPAIKQHEYAFAQKTFEPVGTP